MKKQFKLLGTLGAVTVLGLCALNFIKPVAADSSANVTLQVMVRDSTTVPSVTIVSPVSDRSYYNSVLPIKVNYTKASEIHYQLTFYRLSRAATSGDPIVNYDIVHTVSPNGTLVSGTDEWNLNLADYGGYGFFRLTANIDGASSTTDSTNFVYTAMGLVKDGSEDGNIEIEVGDGVGHVAAQIFDEEGKAMLNPAMLIQPNMDSKVILNIPDLKLADGKYTIVFTPYDKTGNIIATGNITVEVTVSGGNNVIPFVPNTGSTMLEEMNLKNSDFVAALTTLFVAVLVGGAVLLKKTNKSRR